MNSRSWPNTSFLDLAGIEHPIAQAPIGGAAGPDLVAAVSNAGGLGVLGLAAMPAEAVRQAVRKTRELTGRPFGVNMVLKLPIDGYFPLLIDEGVKIFSFAWGDCSPFIEPIHRAGGIVISSVGNVAEGREAVLQGVDVLVAQGWEAGGHVRGTLSTMALVPALVDAVGDVPVLAAGSIADGRGIAAALALGAAGVWLGTRYIAATEAFIHPHYRARVLAAATGDTIYTSELFHLGWENIPHRVLTCDASRRWEAAGRPAPGFRGDDGVIVGRFSGGEIPAYACTTVTADIEGDVEQMSMWCGQGVGLFDREQGAAEITADLVAQTRAVLSRLGV